MSDWKDEFDRRCRRLLGVTDDSQPVSIETEYEWYSTATGGSMSVTLRVGNERGDFGDVGDIIRALDEVEL